MTALQIAQRLQRAAYSPDALIDAGLSSDQARRLLADGPRAVPERPRVRLTGRRRGPPTSTYIWGPDAALLLRDDAWR
jgi:hypothetical protein